jgi:hypothetical protein
MMMGYMYGGKEGMMYAAAANHLMQDLMSDMLIRTVRYAGRDFFESMLNYYGLVNHHSHRRRRRRRSVRSRARLESIRGGREIIWRQGGRYIAVIDMVAYKMCCILILVHLEYPPPVIRQLNRRIILAIVRERGV